MIGVKKLIAIVGLVAALAIGAACSDGEAATPASPPTTSNLPSESVSALASASLQSQATGSQAGIWVTGEGVIALEPDLALLNIGVESTRATVTEARAEAADAMDAIVAALTARGLVDADIQTRSFSISPRYEWMEVFEEGMRSNRQVLVGYMVQNSASIKIRNLDDVGSIIDEVAEAGGDVTRINGIRFTVEDTKPLMIQLREMAVEDALAKADQFADLTGVALGRLVFISETGGAAPVTRDFEDMEFAAMAMSAPSTPISGGELELRITIRAVFDIL